MFMCLYKVKIGSSSLHLVCVLLLLIESSVTALGTDPPSAIPITQRTDTQANCTSCAKNGFSSNATVENSTETSLNSTPTLPPTKNLTPVSVGPKLDDTVESFIPKKQSDGKNSLSTAFLSSQQTVSPDPLLRTTKTVTEPAAFIPSNNTQPPPPPPPTTAPPPTTPTTTTTTPTTATTTTTASTTDTTLVQHEITTKPIYETTTTTASTVSTTIAITTKTTLPSTTGINATTNERTTSPLLSSATPQSNGSSTGLPLVHSTSSVIVPATRTVSSTAPEMTTNHNKQGDVRDDLSRNLIDTAFLLALLICGLLFFLIIVSVFVIQAYESYKRKDYTQVDYLINGMYTDSSV